MEKTNFHEKTFFQHLRAFCKKINCPFRKFADFTKLIYAKIDKHPVRFAVCWSLLLTLFMETMGRFSTSNIFGGFVFMFTDPLVFLYNALLLFATLTVASVFKRQACIFSLISVWWIFVAITNGIILTQRMTPFTMNDLSVVEDGFSIVSTYLNKFSIALFFGVAALAVVAVIILFVKGPQKKNHKRVRNIALYLMTVMLCILSTSLMVSAGKLETFFGNIATAYRDYGTAYCFINTWTNTGIHKPQDYSEENIHKLFGGQKLPESEEVFAEQESNSDTPNILFLQLESFIDPELVNHIELSEDAVPTFRRLKAEYPSGKLTVPACGAGTANVEFEVLTGYSLKFFGPGEYPYRTVLQDTAAETLAYDLRGLGYSSHAIHNHRGVFYSRDRVFANMGFDTFTSVEYMQNVEKTPKNWSKDMVLCDYILKALANTESRDMIYTISAQGHGKYPAKQVIKEPVISVTSAPSDELKWRWEYYVNQLHEMDAFLERLISALTEWKEPVVLALYGDHVPAIDLTEKDLVTGDLYNTEYVIWSNFDMPMEDADIYSYDLATTILEALGIRVGTAFTYKLDNRSSETYLEGLKVLAYDTLYGHRYVYGGEMPYAPTDLKLGLDKIRITEIIRAKEGYYIKGENFTKYSKLNLNGDILSTKFIDKNTLQLLSKVETKDLRKLKISQVEEKSKKVMSTTE